jgi:hypothetical protein
VDVVPLLPAVEMQEGEKTEICSERGGSSGAARFLFAVSAAKREV